LSQVFDVEIRSATPADYPAIREVHEQAFGRPNEARLVEAIRTSPRFIRDLSLVAEQWGTLVGHVLFSTIMVVDDAGSSELLALAPVGVRPEWQRRGIGGQLIRAGLERAAVLGHRAVVLVGHPTYYPRFGFSPARDFGLECPFPVPDDVFMAHPLQPNGLDGVRGIVVYPPAFAEV
jgi:putative acetyltransferase